MELKKTRVLKFGGTSVQSPERIQKIASFLAENHQKGDRQVVVVSAMGKTTDELFNLACEINECPPSREMDMLLTAGERISMALLSMALNKLNVEAISLTGSQAGIITTNHHQKAKIKRVLGDRIRKGIEANQIVIVAGFQGVSESKEITTLGRGGSDTSAIALSICLGLEECELYTDVDGVFSAAPNLVSTAKQIAQLDHLQALEFAANGAQILHPRCVELAKKHGISIWIRNSLKLGTSKMETLITKSNPKSDLESTRVLGVHLDSESTPIRMTLSRASLLGSVLSHLGDQGLKLKWTQFHQSELFGVIPNGDRKDWKKALEKFASDGSLSDFEFIEDSNLVSVSFDGQASDSDFLSRSLGFLSSQEIFPEKVFTDLTHLRFLITQNRVEDAVQVLHNQWIEGSNGLEK